MKKTAIFLLLICFGFSVNSPATEFSKKIPLEIARDELGLILKGEPISVSFPIFKRNLKSSLEIPGYPYGINPGDILVGAAYSCIYPSETLYFYEQTKPIVNIKSDVALKILKDKSVWSKCKKHLEQGIVPLTVLDRDTLIPKHVLVSVSDLESLKLEDLEDGPKHFINWEVKSVNPEIRDSDMFMPGDVIFALSLLTITLDDRKDRRKEYFYANDIFGSFIPDTKANSVMLSHRNNTRASTLIYHLIRNGRYEGVYFLNWPTQVKP